MGPNTVFNVLTEFRFDIAHAVAGSQTLQGEIGKISSAADQAHYNIQRIGVGLVAQMGLGSGGFLGTLYTAIQASDKFAQSQRQIANVFLSNGMFEGVMAFENAMAASASSMNNMKKAAREFSLPTSELVSTSKLIGAVLVNHGLDDAGLTNSTTLARGYLKSAPTLGIDPGMAQGQLLDAVMGRANMGDTLIQRLFNETSAMKQYAPKGANQKGGGAALFNALEPAKRLEVLSKALLQFGSNTKILEENARSMSQQLVRLKDNITGMFSVLKPLGDALMGPIKMILWEVNKFLENDGEKIINNFSKIIRRFFKDPEKLFVNIQQARRLQSDVKLAGHTLFLISAINTLGWALSRLGITFSGGLLMQGLRYFGTALAWIGSKMFSLSALTVVFRALWFVASKVLAPLFAITTLFQILSRALAKAEVFNAKWLVNHMAQFSELSARLSKALGDIMLPLTWIVEFWSDMISWIFRLEVSGNVLLWLFKKLVEVFEALGFLIVATLSILNGLMASYMGAMFDILQMDFFNIGKNIGKNFKEGFEEMMASRFQRSGIGVDDSQMSKKQINIDKIEINNQFKEQMEPDRIAFILKDQLMKAAVNPQQSAGRTMAGALSAG